MKKTIALLLALALCLGLYACGNSSVNTTDSSDTTAPSSATAMDDPEKEDKYQRAIEALAIFQEEPKHDFSYYESLEEVYNMWVELGDYKDAESYRTRFIVLSNVLLYLEERTTDAFDRENRAIIQFFGYDAYGNQIWQIGAHDSFSYSYDENGLLIEERDSFGDDYSYIKSYTYDDAGRLINTNKRYEDGTIFFADYQYEDDESYWITNSEGKTGYYSIKTDANGRVTEEIRYPQEYFDDKIPYSYHVNLYEYDDQGNRTKHQGITYSVEEYLVGGEYHTTTDEIFNSSSTYVYENGVLVGRYDSGDNGEHYYCYIYGTFYWYNAPEE